MVVSVAMAVVDKRVALAEAAITAVKVEQARYALWLQAYAIDATFIKVKGGSE